MSYVARILRDGEQILYRTRLHWVVYLGASGFLLFGAGVWAYVGRNTAHSVLGIFGMLPGLLLFVKAHLQQRLEEHVVTTDRVISRTGIVRRDVYVYPLDSIQTIDIRQGLMGRILGYGSVEFHTSADRHGAGGRGYICNPERWRSQILCAMDLRAGTTRQESPDQAEPARRLQQLEQLRKDGLITEEEYKKKRDDLIVSL